MVALLVAASLAAVALAVEQRAVEGTTEAREASAWAKATVEAPMVALLVAASVAVVALAVERRAAEGTKGDAKLAAWVEATESQAGWWIPSLSSIAE